MKKFRWLIFVCYALFAAACGSSAPHQVASEEFAPEFAGRTYKSFLVIAAYTDRTFRVSAETSMVEELKSRGLQAAPSYDLLPDLGAAVDEAALRGLLSSSGHDAVLAIATLEEGYDYDAGDYMATRGMVYMLGGEPGAGTDIGSLIAWAGSGQYSLLVALWDADSQKAIWQATTDSYATGSESQDLKALADFVVQNLQAKGVL